MVRKIRLGVNVDHVATLRESRKITYPDPLFAALISLSAGADLITIHLREDRRHIQDNDVLKIRRAVDNLNLEMACVPQIVSFALKVKPNKVTLVPEKREELTTEGGLDLSKNYDTLKESIKTLKSNGIEVSLFIDPDEVSVEKSSMLGADSVELHTGRYADSIDEIERNFELERLKKASFLAKEAGLKVYAGHGLNKDNLFEVALLPEVEELNIGHSIVSRSIFVGIYRAVEEIVEKLNFASVLRENKSI
uniref:Pyridoxine 5'-phosphate synthase n=1 Tax=Thermodesulfobium narugense TaxID=184064 RepID=A0A7C5KBU4_9BACT